MLQTHAIQGLISFEFEINDGINDVPRAAPVIINREVKSALWSVRLLFSSNCT